MYKRVKDQIANQTRKDVGFVDLKSSKGRLHANEKQTATTIYGEGAQQFSWDKSWYLLNRQSPTSQGYFPHIVPVLDKDLYSTFYLSL